MAARQNCDNRSAHGVALGADEAVSIAAQRGTVVHCHAGRIWITHEGDARDYVVPAGAHFRCAGAGRIVVSALTADARIAVYRVAARSHAAWTRSGVHLDADFVGFECPDYFVVGYGMDVAHAFRELPFVGIVKGDAWTPDI